MSKTKSPARARGLKYTGYFFLTLVASGVPDENLQHTVFRVQPRLPIGAAAWKAQDREDRADLPDGRIHFDEITESALSGLVMRDCLLAHHRRPLLERNRGRQDRWTKDHVEHPAAGAFRRRRLRCPFDRHLDRLWIDMLSRQSASRALLLVWHSIPRSSRTLENLVS